VAKKALCKILENKHIIIVVLVVVVHVAVVEIHLVRVIIVGSSLGTAFNFRKILYFTKRILYKNYIPTKSNFCLFLGLRFIFDAGDFAAFTQKHALFISP
jgi:hypothetical protein